MDDVDCFKDRHGRIWKRKAVMRVVEGNGGAVGIGGGGSFARRKCGYRRRKGVVSSNHLYHVARITRIATVNVDTFLQTGRAILVLNELSRYKVDLAGLQEVRWPGNGEMFVGVIV